MITHADSEDRKFFVFHCLADILHRSITGIRIARTIGNKQSVKFESIEVIIPRDTNHFNITFQQTTDDISLYTAIHQYHFPFIRTFIIANHFLATYFIYIVNACISSFKNIVRFIVKNNLSQHHAMFAEYFSQFAGINACDAGNLLTFQPVAETFNSIPMTVFVRIVTYDNRFRMNLLTFHKSSESVRFD